MNKMFSDNAWQDFLLWMREDRKTAKKIASLLADIERNGNEGLGKPESLKGNLSGYWSRRISEKDRLIYRFDETTKFGFLVSIKPTPFQIEYWVVCFTFGPSFAPSPSFPSSARRGFLILSFLFF